MFGNEQYLWVFGQIGAEVRGFSLAGRDFLVGHFLCFVLLLDFDPIWSGVRLVVQSGFFFVRIFGNLDDFSGFSWSLRCTGQSV